MSSTKLFSKLSLILLLANFSGTVTAQNFNWIAGGGVDHSYGYPSLSASHTISQGAGANILQNFGTTSSTVSVGKGEWDEDDNGDLFAKSVVTSRQAGFHEVTTDFDANENIWNTHADFVAQLRSRLGTTGMDWGSDMWAEYEGYVFSAVLRSPLVGQPAAKPWLVQEVDQNNAVVWSNDFAPTFSHTGTAVQLSCVGNINLTMVVDIMRLGGTNTTQCFAKGWVQP